MTIYKKMKISRIGRSRLPSGAIVVSTLVGIVISITGRLAGMPVTKVTRESYEKQGKKLGVRIILTQ